MTRRHRRSSGCRRFCPPQSPYGLIKETEGLIARFDAVNSALICRAA